MPTSLVAPLYGGLESAVQDEAIDPAPAGKRKVVLATSIAETSLTIEGVRVVIDCGVARVPRFEPGVGITRLETVRVSRASADQRRGRAGRTAPGVCYRLWDEAETASLLPFADPEIRSADLSPLLLDCAEWGVTDPRTLAWLDVPTDAALDAAREELLSLGALDADGPHHRGRQAAQAIAAASAPRAHGDEGRRAWRGAGAADIAALLVERGLGGNDTSLEVRSIISAAIADGGRGICAAWPKYGRRRRGGGPGLPLLPVGISRRRSCLRSDTQIALPKRGVHRGSFCSRAGEGRFSTQPMRSRARPFSPSPRCRARQRRHASCWRRLPPKPIFSQLRKIVSSSVRSCRSISRRGPVRARRVRRLDAIELASEPLRRRPRA